MNILGVTMNLSIGELSRRSGVKVPTVRYYEEIGLLPAPPRSEGGQRRYDDGAIRRLSFISHARDLGIGIEDIRGLIGMAACPQASCHEADSIARHHLGEVESRISALTALREELIRMVGECGHGRICDCRVIEVLADHSKCSGDHAHSV